MKYSVAIIALLGLCEVNAISIQKHHHHHSHHESQMVGTHEEPLDNKADAAPKEDAKDAAPAGDAKDAKKEEDPKSPEAVEKR